MMMIMVMTKIPGTLVYNFNLCCVDVIAPSTDNLLTLDLIFDAVPYSSLIMIIRIIIIIIMIIIITIMIIPVNILLIRETWSFGGMIKEIILVPFPIIININISIKIDI